MPIPTAVVPMMQHYTDLYQRTSTPTVDINLFPFERNEYMDNRTSMMQGNKWWEALLGTLALPVVVVASEIPSDVPQKTASQTPQISLRRRRINPIMALPPPFHPRDLIPGHNLRDPLLRMALNTPQCLRRPLQTSPKHLCHRPTKSRTMPLKFF